MSGNDADFIRSRSNYITVRFCIAGWRLVFHLEQSTKAHNRSEEDEDLKTTERLANTASSAKAERIERLSQSAIDNQRTISIYVLGAISCSGGSRIRLVVVGICRKWARACSAWKDICRQASVTIAQESLRAEDVRVDVPDVRITSDRPQVGDDDAAGRYRQRATFVGRRCVGNIDVDFSEVRQSERYDRRQSHRFQYDGLDVRQSSPVVVCHRLICDQFPIQLRLHAPL